MVYLRTFGGLTLHPDDERGRSLASGTKPLLLLAVLATFANREARRDYLSQLIWSDVPRAKALASLRTALHSISRLAPGVLVADSSRVALDAAKIEVDLWRFQSAVSQRFFREVVGIHRGPFLDGIESKVSRELRGLIEMENDRASAALESAYDVLIESAMADGRLQEAVSQAREFYGRNPLSGRAAEALIDALALSGDVVAAVQVFDGYKSLLRSELDDEPEPGLVERVDALRSRLSESAGWTDAPSGEGRGVGAAGWLRPVSVRQGAMVAAAASVAWWAASRDWSEPSVLDLPDSIHLAQVEVDQGGDRQMAEVRMENGRLSIDLAGLKSWRTVALPSPDDVHLAVSLDNTDGRDLAIVDRLRNVVDTVAITDPDESPLSWSPDGRQVLYRHGERRGSSYLWSLRVLDVTTGALRLLADAPGEVGWASWSPTGATIAFTARVSGSLDSDMTLIVVSLEGEVLSKSPMGPHGVTGPTWSPDGGRVAFVSQGVLNITEPGTYRPVPVATGWVIRSVAWLSPSVLGIVRDTEDGHEFWSFDLRTGVRTRIEGGDAIVAFLSQASFPTYHGWPDTLRLSGLPRSLSPGQVFEVVAQLPTADGRLLNPSEWEPEYSVSGAGVVALDREGWWQATDVGPVRIHASLPGWRSATVELPSVEMEEGARPLLFLEDWSSGILDTATWVPFGVPAPSVQGFGGPDGAGIFLSNGDDSFGSGAVTREPFDLMGGLTMEVSVRGRFSGQHWENGQFGFVSAPPGTEDALDRWVNDDRILFVVVGVDSTLACAGRCDMPPNLLPIPEPEDGWHLYALQVEPLDGDLDNLEITLLVDGGVVWRSAVRTGLGQRFVHGMVEGNMFFSVVEHGPVRIYRGVRFSTTGDPTAPPVPQ